MLRSNLNPEEQSAMLFLKPTPYRTGMNRYRLFCNTCGDIYYVDGDTFYMATLAIQKGLDNPFCCDNCEDDFQWSFAE
jgi:hypothetical protein